MASRTTSTLLPEVQELATEFVARCAGRGVEVLIYCTYRPPEEQAELLARGLTKAPPYKSWHQYRRAFDCVPMVNGKPLWSSHGEGGRLLPEWDIMVSVADLLKLEWAGRWKRFKEFVHFQKTDGMGFKEAAQDLFERGYISSEELEAWLFRLRSSK